MMENTDRREIIMKKVDKHMDGKDAWAGVTQNSSGRFFEASWR